MQYETASLLNLAISLIIDTGFSWIRMFAALGVSIVISIILGIYAATHRFAEKLIIPVIDILQTVPILAFFPVVIFLIVGALPGSLGINIAVVFLIITSMVWNIILGVYEAMKVLPKEYGELSKLYGLSKLEEFRKIYLPAVMPKVAEQSTLSWSIGLFYLVTSEIFSTGNANYAVKTGIGAAIASPAITGSIVSYGMALIIFVAFVIATRLLFFKPFEDYASRYNKHSAKAKARTFPKAVTYAKVMKAFSSRIIKKIGPADNIAKKAKSAKSKKYTYGNADKATIPDRFGYLIKYVIMLAVIVGVVAFFLTSPKMVDYEIEVIKAFAYSFARIWIAFALTLAVGIPISVYIIFVTRHGSRYVLFFQILSSIPATILLPAIVSGLRGLPYYGELVAFIVFFLSGIWYIIFSTLSIAKTLPPNILEVKDIYGVQGGEAWKKIYLKAIIPGLITGAITGIAAEWNAAIVAEYFSIGTNVVSQVSVGVGKLLDLSLTVNNLPLMLLTLINMTAMIIIINTLLWKRLYRRLAKIYGG